MSYMEKTVEWRLGTGRIHIFFCDAVAPLLAQRQLSGKKYDFTTAQIHSLKIKKGRQWDCAMLPEKGKQTSQVREKESSTDLSQAQVRCVPGIKAQGGLPKGQTSKYLELTLLVWPEVCKAQPCYNRLVRNHCNYILALLCLTRGNEFFFSLNYFFHFMSCLSQIIPIIHHYSFLFLMLNICLKNAYSSHENERESNLARILKKIIGR